MTNRPLSPSSLILLAAALLASCNAPEERFLGSGEEPERLASALAIVGPSFKDELVADGLATPTLMEFAPDGRLFVSEKAGTLRIIKNGVLLATPFLALNVSTQGEQGLLGITFHPQFSSNRQLFLYYTSSSGPHNRVSRFTASAGNPDMVEPGSEVVLIDLPNPPSPSGNHNGGAIHFGKDGKLFIAVGDGVGPANSQSLQTTLGKMLRINPDGSIPADNPFYGSTTGINRAIVALGLRNPFTFAVQPGTGRIFVNDVGQNAQEEIDDLVPGANYGWPHSEGYLDTAGYTAPIHAYTHSDGCAITGGDFYNPPSPTFPADMTGDYFFSDMCGGWIKRLDPATGAVETLATSARAPTEIRVGRDGSLYYIEYANGAIRRIRPSSEPIRLEAEAAAWNGPVVSTAFSGFTGSGYLDFQNSQGDWVEFSGTLATAANIPLTLRYANGSGASIPVRVSLNGAVLAESLPLPSTGSWNTWGQVSGTVAFPAGPNTLRITTLGGQPNIDHLRAY